MGELTLYQKILESNLVNFIIMVSVLVLIFKKAKLGRYIDKMADDIKNSVSTSAQAAEAALKEYKEAKRNTKNVQTEKNSIIEKANDTALNIKNSAALALKEEETGLDNKCSFQIETDIKKVKENTASDILNAVSDLVEDEIKRRLDASVQKKFTDMCIENIDKIGDREFQSMKTGL